MSLQYHTTSMNLVSGDLNSKSSSASQVSFYGTKSKETHSSSSGASSPSLPKQSSVDNFCCMCSGSFLPGMQLLKCENCDRDMCKLHSVTIGNTEKSRICDKCQDRRLTGKEYQIEGLEEKLKAIKLKIRYFAEEIERREQELNLKTTSNQRMKSQIDKTTKFVQNKEKDLQYKLAQERAQNERLNNISENLKKAVEDSRANVAHIESEYSRYTSENTLATFEHDALVDDNHQLMSEVDQLNISLKERAPIFKLNSMTCTQCFAQIMRVQTKGDKTSFVELDERADRNVKVLQRLSVIRKNEESSSKACNNCIII